MSPEQTFETIPVETLLERVRTFREQGWRLVQIGATRLPDQLELTYSFDRENRLANLRLALLGDQPKVPSVSSIFWCAFLYENELHDLFNLQVSDLAIDFQGHFYKTAVKFPFGTTKPPVAKPTAAATFAAPQPTSAKA
jgi:ech hydrogenase subunit D